MTTSFEMLYFMVKDGIISRFQQLHVAMEIGKLSVFTFVTRVKTDLEKCI